MEASKYGSMVFSSQETEMKEMSNIQKGGNSLENDEGSNSEEPIWDGWEELMGKDLMMLKVREKGNTPFPT